MHITNSNVPQQNSPSSSIHNGKFGEIVQQFNFNKISHDEIQQLGKELRDAGAITDEQFLDITAPYFANPAMNSNRSSAEKINYPEELHKLMLFQQKNQAADLESLAHIQKVSQYFDQLSKGIPLVNTSA